VLAVGNPDLGGETRLARTALMGEDAPDLPSAAEEARAIADPARGDVLLLGAAADERALRRGLFEGARPFAVLHLACHGVLYSARPSLSALLLRPSGVDDGLLTVEEVSAWRFPLGPPLVVLSACRSGQGVPVSGDGEEGLVRAFLLAGARHVVASLWSVPDRTTRDLMVAFHRIRRAEGLPPCECLRRAQAEIVAARGGRLPARDWAGWCVWGPRR
jgi:CHAT domain-containing protein